MIELTNIEKRFGSKRVLRNINLKLREGKVYGLFGPNGVGKTTLLKIMAGYNKKTSGEYKINEQDFTYKDKDHITLKESFPIIDDSQILLTVNILKSVYSLVDKNDEL